MDRRVLQLAGAFDRARPSLYEVEGGLWRLRPNVELPGLVVCADGRRETLEELVGILAGC